MFTLNRKWQELPWFLLFHLKDQMCWKLSTVGLLLEQFKHLETLFVKFKLTKSFKGLKHSHTLFWETTRRYEEKNPTKNIICLCDHVTVSESHGRDTQEEELRSWPITSLHCVSPASVNVFKVWTSLNWRKIQTYLKVKPSKTDVRLSLNVWQTDRAESKSPVWTSKATISTADALPAQKDRWETVEGVTVDLLCFPSHKLHDHTHPPAQSV